MHLGQLQSSDVFALMTVSIMIISVYCDSGQDLVDCLVPAWFSWASLSFNVRTFRFRLPAAQRFVELRCTLHCSYTKVPVRCNIVDALIVVHTV